MHEFFKKYGEPHAFRQRRFFSYAYKPEHEKEVLELKKSEGIDLKNKMCGFIPSFIDFNISAEEVERVYEPLEDQMNAIQVERKLEVPRSIILLGYQCATLHTQFLPSETLVEVSGNESEDERKEPSSTFLKDYEASMFDFGDVLHGGANVPCREALTLFENIVDSLHIIYPTEFRIDDKIKGVKEEYTALSKIKNNPLFGEDIEAHLPVMIKCFGYGGKPYFYLNNHFAWDNRSIVEEFIVPQENRFGIAYDLQDDINRAIGKIINHFRLSVHELYGSLLGIEFSFDNDILKSVTLTAKDKAEEYKNIVKNLKGKVDMIVENNFIEASK